MDHLNSRVDEQLQLQRKLEEETFVGKEQHKELAEEFEEGSEAAIQKEKQFSMDEQGLVEGAKHDVDTWLDIDREIVRSTRTCYDHHPFLFGIKTVRQEVLSPLREVDFVEDGQLPLEEVLSPLREVDPIRLEQQVGVESLQIVLFIFWILV